ncbi:MAG: hypothetical protein GF364_12655 [Candidatus Lokiarchaeota archaeon]|nr:hypothetical protein [Candidatus Lokiarchaeota archaeon]
MSKIITERQGLLDLLHNIVQEYQPNVKPEDLAPVLDRALTNFQREMNKPFYEFRDTDEDIKIRIFQILLKHIIIELKNEPTFRNADFLDDCINKIEGLGEK